MPLYPQNVTSKGAHPTPSPSDVFTLRFGVESIEELGGASNQVNGQRELVFKRIF
jgi:hypothetical protein